MQRRTAIRAQSASNRELRGASDMTRHQSFAMIARQIPTSSQRHGRCLIPLSIRIGRFWCACDVRSGARRLEERIFVHHAVCDPGRRFALLVGCRSCNRCRACPGVQTACKWKVPAAQVGPPTLKEARSSMNASARRQAVDREEYWDVALDAFCPSGARIRSL